jgi:serine protease AprX
LTAVNGRIKKSFYNLGLVSAELPLSQIRELIKSENVEYISPDRDVQSFQHLGTTTGWYLPGISDGGDTDPNTWLDGGVGHIAVIDSGIDSQHYLLNWRYTGTPQSKVKYNKDFTGQGITGDPYGHGSHVASMFAGDNAVSNSAYQGIAPASNLINLRVLNSVGLGSVSNLIAALDWTVANKTAWNIRVINMSLGTAAKDSYKNDPLCLAARRAVNAGIVVVASAGNFGKDLMGNKLYGTIGSPGIEPSVITVGAANTYGTGYRGDDTVATFSSRGPTRGYVTLTNGARKYDNLIKPDLIAPGNKLIGARGYYNGTENFLSRTFTTLQTGNATSNNEKVMYLSGTSMSAPVVSGAVSLLLETNPNLTPNLVKAILMYSAQSLPGFSTVEQGAGLLNVDGAVRIARLVKPTLPTTNGSALLKASLPASQSTDFWGTTTYWGKGVITNFGFIYGNDLMNKYQGMYANGVLMSDSTPLSGSSLTKSTTLTSGTLSLYQGAIKNNGVLMSDGTLYLGANAMGGSPTPFVNGQGVLVSDGVLMSDGVLIGDGVLMADGNAYSTQALLGDNTACMQPAP